MLHALDTNTCIDLLRGKSRLVRDRMQELSPAQIAIPSLVYAELLLGAELSASSSCNRHLIERFTAPLCILDFDMRAAAAYAVIRARLMKDGLSIGPNDIIIAATALSNQAILITANIREFSRVPGLLVENWTV